MQSSSDIGLVANSFHRCWPTAVIILFTSLGGKWRNAVDSPLFDVVEALAAFVLIGIHNGWLNGPSKDSRGGSDHRCITDASVMHHRCVPCTSTTKPPWNLKRSADLEDPQVFGYRYLLKGRCSSQSLPAVTWEHREQAARDPAEYSYAMLYLDMLLNLWGWCESSNDKPPILWWFMRPIHIYPFIVKLGMLYYCCTHIVTFTGNYQGEISMNIWIWIVFFVLVFGWPVA